MNDNILYHALSTPPPAAPRQAIMPDRSLTYSRAGASPIPSQPACFHRLDEILTAPRSIESTRLDRLAVQRLFGVRERYRLVDDLDLARHHRGLIVSRSRRSYVRERRIEDLS